MTVTFTIESVNSSVAHPFQGDVTEQGANTLHIIFDHAKQVERLRTALGGPGTASQTKFSLTTNEKPARVFRDCALGTVSGSEVSVTHG